MRFWNWLVTHPFVFGLLGIPALLALLPGLIKKGTVAGLHKAIAQGDDEADHELIREIIAAFVKWAEAKYAEGKGPLKFEAVDALAAKALPFMGADDRRKLIEEAVKALDDGAHDATQPPAQP